MHDHPDRQGGLRVQRHVRPALLDAAGAVLVDLQLLPDDLAQRQVAPALPGEQAVGSSQRADPAHEAGAESLQRLRPGQGLRRDGVDHGQHVAHPMVDLVHQEALLLLGLRPAR